MKNTTLLILLIILFNFDASAQKETPFIKGQVMVQFTEEFSDIHQVVEKNKVFKGQKTSLKIEEVLSEMLNIWLLSFDAEQVNHSEFTHHLALNRNIIAFQNNHIISKRATTPNDTYFNQQWQYINPGGSGGIVGADIDADLAWDITTGGVTPLGDTIVVCVVDDGLFQSQQDFEDNLWVNRQEIPNNNIDDDNNGYIDDYLGYNANTNNDAIYANSYSHGTAVAGVVGAKGNNNFGVAGINWNVKLMIVKNQGASESQVIKAYSYPLKMRKLYNDTNGQKGAFVVAVNSSWGIDQGNPASVPLWCAFYDQMGAEGILNAAATANEENNVDVVGDLPTGCSSDYLITVTNVARNDQKVQSAGYGATTIDLGAFGQGAFTVSDTDPVGFDGFGGTSGATPQVAGAIALLYAAPCPWFAQLYKSNPSQAALDAKKHILNGTDANSSLQGITVSGGRLNLNGMLSELNAACDECGVVPDVSIKEVWDTKVLVVVQGISVANSYEYRYKKLTEPNWIAISSIDTFLEIPNLDSQTDYEVQVRAFCDSSASMHSTSQDFSTNFLPIQSLYNKSDISIYPNPTNQFLTISFHKLPRNTQVSILDISGKQLYTSEVFTQKNKIDLSYLAKGVYILKIKDENGKLSSFKISKL